MLRAALMLLLADVLLFGRETPLEKLQHEAVRLRRPHGEKGPGEEVEGREALHRALREWIESQLPRNKAELAGEPTRLNSKLQDELEKAGMTPPDVPETPEMIGDYPEIGYVGVGVTAAVQLPDTLIVNGWATVPCGSDDAIYLYRFDETGWTRTLENHPGGRYTDTRIKFSEPDASGQRLMLIQAVWSQCQSFWRGMAYSVYRLRPRGVVEPLLSETHGFYAGEEPLFVLSPREVIVEFRDWSVASRVHDRTLIDRYSFMNDVPRRLDPVALQPQDFVEEWLTNSWSEMQTRSAPGTERWHTGLTADWLQADYIGVGQCGSSWIIGLNILPGGAHALTVDPSAAGDNGKAVYFQVRESGEHHYTMEAVSQSRPEGCLDLDAASDTSPFLSEAALRQLK